MGKDTVSPDTADTPSTVHAHLPSDPIDLRRPSESCVPTRADHPHDTSQISLPPRALPLGGAGLSDVYRHRRARFRPASQARTEAPSTPAAPTPSDSHSTATARPGCTEAAREKVGLPRVAERLKIRSPRTASASWFSSRAQLRAPRLDPPVVDGLRGLHLPGGSTGVDQPATLGTCRACPPRTPRRGTHTAARSVCRRGSETRSSKRTV